MHEYDEPVILPGGIRGRLRVIRLPRSWYGVVWVSPSLYQSASQVETHQDENGGFSRKDDESFLGHVRLVFGFGFGIDFDFVRPGVDRGLEDMIPGGSA